MKILKAISKLITTSTDELTNISTDALKIASLNTLVTLKETELEAIKSLKALKAEDKYTAADYKLIERK